MAVTFFISGGLMYAIMHVFLLCLCLKLLYDFPFTNLCPKPFGEFPGATNG